MSKSKRVTAGESGFSLVELTIVSVVLVIVVGITAGVVSSIQRGYSQHRPRTEALNDATAALDMLTRLIRMAGNNPGNIANLKRIEPGGTVSGSSSSTIRIRSDWRGNAVESPPDSDTADPFENVLFSVSDNRLMKQESTDPSPEIFLDNVNSIVFTYYDSNNSLIANPVASSALISRVDIRIVMKAPDTPPMTFTSSAFVRLK